MEKRYENPRFGALRDMVWQKGFIFLVILKPPGGRPAEGSAALIIHQKEEQQISGSSEFYINFLS